MKLTGRLYKIKSGQIKAKLYISTGTTKYKTVRDNKEEAKAEAEEWAKVEDHTITWFN